MARARSQGNGRVDRLEEAMSKLAEDQSNLARAQVNLVQAQSNLAQVQAAFLVEMAELQRISTERWSHIQERFARIEAILLERTRIPRALPDAICQALGFRAAGRAG
jgi:hypothetical protein